MYEVIATQGSRMNRTIHTWKFQTNHDQLGKAILPSRATATSVIVKHQTTRNTRHPLA